MKRRKLSVDEWPDHDLFLKVARDTDQDDEETLAIAERIVFSIDKKEGPELRRKLSDDTRAIQTALDSILRLETLPFETRRDLAITPQLLLAKWLDAFELTSRYFLALQSRKSR